MELILIRHTPCDVEQGMCYGRLDLPLASTAPADIERTLARTPRVHLVFSSPSQRCHALALALAGRDGCEIRVRPELQELDFGEWEGQRWSAIPRAVSDEWTADPWTRRPPGGESELELAGRVVRVAVQLRELPETQRIAVVSHGGPLRLLRCLLTGTPISERWTLSMNCGQVVSIPRTSLKLTAPPGSACPSSDP
jgi:alpha-ribazole phosphatase